MINALLIGGFLASFVALMVSRATIRLSWLHAWLADSAFLASWLIVLWWRVTGSINWGQIALILVLTPPLVALVAFKHGFPDWLAHAGSKDDRRLKEQMRRVREAGLDKR